MKSRHSRMLQSVALAMRGARLPSILGIALLIGSITLAPLARAASERLVLPPEPKPFMGKMAMTYQDSIPDWSQIRPLQAPKGAPNILVIVLDDVGYGQLGAYGSSIHTPNIDKLAQRGVRFTNFHTSALCSPTRAALLTGRNHESVGIGMITEGATGFPGYNGHIPRSDASLAEILKQNGYNTMAFGKWHLTPYEALTQAGPFDQWPLGLGFERFYGFLGGETDQWTPLLVQDNTQLPVAPSKGYHLSEDLADRAIRAIHDQQQVNTGRPFFEYLALGAAHAPLQAPRAYIEHYRGQFDQGWDHEREVVFTRQKAMGLMPQDAVLPPRNPGVEAWDALSDDQKKLYTRQQEAFAGFLEHADSQIGRVLDAIDAMGIRDNTLVLLLSDNGASQEGLQSGATNTDRYRNFLPQSVAEMLKEADHIGDPGTDPHYPQGWAMAGNTPFRYWKQNTYEGGITDPLIIAWPGHLQGEGGLRRQFTHVVDVAPTLLDAIGIPAPTSVNGIKQTPMQGVSFLYALDHPEQATHKHIQYFEMLGSRALWADGWKAVTWHRPNSGHWQDDHWQLFHMDVDPTESNDLSTQEPGRLAALQKLWSQEAQANNALPMDDRTFQRANDPTRPAVSIPTQHYRFYPDTAIIHPLAGPKLQGRSYRITAQLQVGDQPPEGVLVSFGGEFGGWSFYLRQGQLHYVHNFLKVERYDVGAPLSLAPGLHSLSVTFTATGRDPATPPHYLTGDVRLEVDGRQVAACSELHVAAVGYAMTSGFGWQIGRNEGTAVTADYEVPFRIRAGLQHVDVDLLPDAASASGATQASKE